MSASTSGSDAMALRRSDVTRNSSREQASCGSLSDFKPTYTVMFASDGEMRLRKCCANCLAEVCGPRLCCNECAGLVLCPECFSAGAELGTHRRMHSYRWEDGGFAPLIGGPMPWGAHEEELLLEAVEQHGLGNWEGAAAAMGGSRSASDVAAHFFAVYIEGNLGQACLPPHVTSRVHDHNTASQLPLSSPPEQLNLSSLEQGALGFAPLRGDFDVEPDPGAESLVASLCFDPATEDDLEMELKRALASVYVQRLRERHRRKAVALDYGLIDTFFGHSTGRSFGLTSQLSVESRKSNSTTNSGLTQTSFDGRKSGKAGANATGNSISGLTSAISTDSRKAAKLCGNTAANTSAASGILVSMNGSCETRRALPMEPRTRLPALFGIVTCKELDKLEEMLRRERALRTRVRELQRWRRHGVTAVTDGAGFEAAARLQRAPKPADALTTTEGSLATFASTFSLPSTNAFPAASWDFLSMGEKAVCDVAGLAPGQYITTKATLLLQGPGRPGGGSGTGNVGLDRQQWKRVQRFLVRNRWYGPRQAA